MHEKPSEQLSPGLRETTREQGNTTEVQVPPYAKRYAAYYDHNGVHYETLAGTLWTMYQGMVMPLGPASRNNTVTKNEARTLLSRFPKAVLLRACDGFQKEATPGQWYAVICRRFLDLGECSSKRRSEIRRGMKNCRVEKVDAQHIATRAYEPFMAAHDRYSGAGRPNVSKESFKNSVLSNQDFPDLRHYWAVSVEGNLVGYSANMIFGEEEVSYTQVKVHPAFLKAYPSYALFYRMNEHYLGENSFSYVNDGYRAVLHQTQIQDFLIRKFGFERAYSNLYIDYRPLVAFALSLPAGVKRWLAQRRTAFAALCALDEARTERA